MFDQLLGAHPFGVAVGVAVAYAAYKVLRFLDLRRRIPPGPFPLPLLGNLLSFKGEQSSVERLITLARKHGDPMSLWLGSSLNVVLTSKETIRDALVTQQAVFCSRQESALFDLVLQGSTDIALGKYGPVWKVHRKLATRSMRSIIDAEALENKVNDAVRSVADSLRDTHSAPVQLTDYVSNAVFNVICSFAYGKSYSVDDAEFKRLMYLNKRGNEAFTEILVMDFLPFAKYLPLETMSATLRETVAIFKEMVDFIDKQIAEHRQTYEEGVTRDFIDSMIKEQKALENEGEEKLHSLTDRHLTMIVIDFFNAGTDTTSSVLTWLFLYMVMHPDIQERCYKEILEEIGDREPRIADRVNTPFVEACILETLRLRPAAPLAIPHVPITDAKLGDYHIPKGTVVLPNLYAMHTDPKGDFAPNPLDFHPESHFLDCNGEVRKPAGFLPFGAGRRVCLGEQLARNDLYLIATGLLQQLKFSKLPGETYTTEPAPIDGIFYAQPYKVSAAPRK